MPPLTPAASPPGDRVLLYVNGKRRSLPPSAVLDTTLLHHLRSVERLTGAKLGCGEGGCGACTVLVSRYDPASRSLAHAAVNACLLPLAALDGAAVTTVEAVGDRAGRLAPLQAALAHGSASQCGFCTPGIVMSAYSLLRQRAAEGRTVGARAIDHALDGNLCRCTGYRPVLAALRGALGDGGDPAAALCGRGAACCRSGDGGGGCAAPGAAASTAAADPESPVASSYAQDLHFPPELVRYRPGELNLAGRWLRPVTLAGLLAFRRDHPAARLVVGNTEIGVEMRALRNPHAPPPAHLSVGAVPELAAVTDDAARGLVIGAAATCAAVVAAIGNAVAAREGTPRAYQTSSLRAVREQLRWFAGTQVRNVASVGGNLVTASPISDLNPVWVAVGAELVVVDAVSGVERAVAAADFFVAYRTVDLRATEVLLSIVVPWNADCFDLTQAFKTSRRREDDIAIVSAGIRLRLRPPEGGRAWTISGARVGLGGMAPKTIAARDVEEALKGAPFTKATLDRALAAAKASLALPDNVPGGMPAFRLALVMGFLFKSFVSASQLASEAIEAMVPGEGRGRPPAPDLNMDSSVVSSVLRSQEERPLSAGSQIYSSVDASTAPPPRKGHIGQSVVHASAELQVTGEARYVDDMPPQAPGELHGALVLSAKPHARLLAVDTSAAANMEGVVDVVLASDVRGSNAFGVTHVHDELCFAEDVVSCVGQVIGIAVAETLAQAEAAVAAVAVEYEELAAVVHVEEALEEERASPGSRAACRHEIVVGDVDAVFADSPCVTGTVRIGAQEHFYLEPNGSIVVPEENDEFVVYASTQAATKTQEVVSTVLGVPMHKVVCRVKRLGGGFGGKETRSVFVTAAAAVAAQKHKRPVRLILSRHVDMLTTGTRHSLLADYTCSYLPDGRISALQTQLYVNMGNTQDLSIPVLDRALHHCQNCYDIPNVRFVGMALRTNATSATAFRGFGGPQGMLIAETVVEHVAAASGVAPAAVRDLNLYGRNGNGNETLVGMRFDAAPLAQCWDGVLVDAQYEKCVAAAHAFNRQHRYVKRGVAAIPTMFGISFTFKTYNQAGALVHIYHSDGSVLISHGGVEMGQGLHTKICQVAATALGISLDKVFVSDTSTDKVANTSPSAASASTDMYGMAVLDACTQLMARLAAVRKQSPEGATWEQVVNQAWLDRVDLSAHGFYRTPSLDAVDLGQPGARGRPFFYYTNGAAVSVVEVDTLTGLHQVLSSHIVMDVGRSLNPALDIGQIEGAFVQGMGWCTMEEVVRGGGHGAHQWLRPGQMHTLGPGAYKIPGLTDIPAQFSVRVLDGVRNERDTIHSSKAVGEPPLFLASSVFFAIRHAVASARADAGLGGWFELDSPATVERIRTACPDFITDQVSGGEGALRPQMSL
jgi:xanthine dehydrogenase/oxidase